MKKHTISALILSGIMTAALIQAPYASAEDSDITPAALNKHISFDNIKNDIGIDVLPLLSDGVSENTENITLPEKFDLREKGLVTPVKNQGDFGTCWSFAAMNLAESSLIKKNPTIDLSEWLLAYYTYCNEFGFIYNDQELGHFDQGGHDEYTWAMLAGGIGLFKENTNGYEYGNMDIMNDSSSYEEVIDMRSYQVTDLSTFPYWQYDSEVLPKQINAIKKSIYSEKPMAISYMSSDDFYTNDYSAYYFFYDNEMHDGNWHAVSVVGWDDNFPAESFLYTPPMDGAWLCKNSWGTSYGDGGYFWLSYADESLCNFYCLEASPAEQYQNISQYDEYGCVLLTATNDFNQTETSAYAANIFTASEDSAVTDVMVYSLNADEEYEITIFTDLTDPYDPCSGKSSETISGKFQNIGYHTVKIPSSPLVSEGEQYSVVVKLSGDDSYHLACEGSSEYLALYDDDTSKTFPENMLEKCMKDFSAGCSFYSADGIDWHDFYTDGMREYTIDNNSASNDILENFSNDEGLIPISVSCIEYNTAVCIKAFTQPADSVIFSEYERKLPYGTEISLTSPGGNSIMYSVNDGDYKPYTEPIVFDRDMILSAYTQEGKVFRRSYSQQQAIASEIVYNDYGTMRYFDETSDEGTSYNAYIQPETEEVYLKIVSQGNIKIDGETVLSGNYYPVSTMNDADSVTVEISAEGCQTTVYTVSFTDVNTVTGDVNLDGIISIDDATAALLIYAEDAAGFTEHAFSIQQRMNADVNCDDRNDITDATIILEYYASNAAGMDITWDDLLCYK